ncbi:MAG: 3-phosphoserine/phosphohydroxythreonine transaminase [Bacillota bacterium]
MSRKVFNFYAGPAGLPASVLEEVQRDLLDYNHSGMSIMEMSHRSKDIETLVDETESLIKELLGLSDNYRVLFLQGGASQQFAMVPMNFLPPGATADYLITGSFAEKACQEAAKIGQVHIAGSTKASKFNRVLEPSEIELSSNPVYVHLTSNNTIYGTQWQEFPDCGDVPMVADMSSDILSRPFKANDFALIYAGAQKNLGPAGVTVVIINTDLLGKVPTTLPGIFRYDIHAENSSMFNTPPVFPTYVVNRVLHWLKNSGGLAAIEELNQKKAALVYTTIDQSECFYKGHAHPGSRSLMNITFRLPNEELEKAFASQAEQRGLLGLKGHRSVGGIRASIYNYMPIEGCMALAEFMQDFCAAHK